MAPDMQAARLNAALDSALDEARAAYTAARPRSSAAHQRARAVLPGGNTRSVLYYTPFPTAMARGEGCMLEDIDGHIYLDLCGEYTAGLFGHSEPRILAALRQTLDTGLSLSAVGENEARLAELLCARVPSLEMVRFTNSGTEANLMALSLARTHTGRPGILAMHGGYHGGLLTFAGGGAPTNAPFPVSLALYNDIETTRGLIASQASELAAVIVEPMIGNGGCMPADPAFLRMLREETARHGILLVFDEVMTSRHAAGGLQSLLGITPDLTTLGKYIGGGMSFGAFGGRRDIMERYDAAQPGALSHSGTFNNNVMSMAAGCVAMGEVFTAAAADALFARGEALRAELEEVCRRHRVRMQFTGRGSMMQPHFRDGPIQRPYALTPQEDALRELLFLDLMAAGIYTARRGMVALSLRVGDAECRRYVEAVDEFCASRVSLLRESA
jgi:glutamate-1-semialdehyde 2,1-aminomutase